MTTSKGVYRNGVSSWSKKLSETSELRIIGLFIVQVNGHYGWNEVKTSTIANVAFRSPEMKETIFLRFVPFSVEGELAFSYEWWYERK